jgi:peptide deformylase
MMPIRPIVITGEPVLHRKAAEVTVFDDELRRLVEDMFETMDAAPGVGLAAPQVGVGLRVFVFDYTQDDIHHRGVVINPQLEISEVPSGEADWESETEGCLSVPGERFPIRRAELARVRGVDLEQRPVEIEAKDWFARIFQHEFDHLEGTLYVDKLAQPYRSEAVEVIIENGWGKPGHSWLPGRDHLEG